MDLQVDQNPTDLRLLVCFPSDAIRIVPRAPMKFQDAVKEFSLKICWNIPTAWFLGSKKVFY